MGVLLAFLCLIAWGAWWTADWRKERPVAASGGLYFPGRLELYVPQFFQSDPRWGEDALGATPGRLAAEGCAVASAAMALASYGVDVDPGRLNKFLTTLPEVTRRRDGFIGRRPRNLTLASRRAYCPTTRTCPLTS